MCSEGGVGNSAGNSCNKALQGTENQARETLFSSFLEAICSIPRTAASGFPAEPLILIGLALVSSVVGAADLASVEQALRSTFPGAQVSRESLFLTPAQLEMVAQESGVDGQRALTTRFTLRIEARVVGWGYLDTHRVRTLPETLLVMIDEKGRIRRVEVVAFREPPDYLPPRRWYEQFNGRPLDDDMELKAGIRPMTGATLSVRAATDAVRRILAVHGAVQGGTR